MVDVKKEGESEQGGKVKNGRRVGFLRFEIVVLLFALIGFYCFLSFSPIRVSKKPLASPRVSLAPLPPIPKAVTSPPKEVAQLVDDAKVSDLPAEAVDPIAESNSESLVDEVPTTPVAGVTPVEPEHNGKLPLENDVQKQKLVPSKVSEPSPTKSAALDTSPTVTPAEEPIPAQASVPAAPPAEIKVVEVGSYVLQSDAQKFRTQLEELGFVVQSETLKRLATMYRVYLGPYSDQQKVKKMMVKVRDMGDQPFLQTHDLGTVVVVSSFYLKESVEALEKTYRAAGYDPKVRELSLMVPHTCLRLDGSRVVEDPEAVLAQLQTAGFSQARLKISSISSK